jgi:hypothetical protein
MHSAKTLKITPRRFIVFKKKFITLNVAFTGEPLRLVSVYTKSMLNLVGSKNFYVITQTRKLAQALANYTLMLTNHTQRPGKLIPLSITPVSRKTSNEVQIVKCGV